MRLQRSWTVVMALVLLVVMVVACVPPPTAAPAETEAAPAETEAAPAETEAAPAETEAATGELEGTLRISAPPWIIKKFPLEDSIDRFTADHPGVTVELNAEDKWNVATHIAEWREGTTSVDLYIGGSGSMLAPVITGEWSVPMDDMLVDDLAPENWVGGFLSAGHYKKPDGSGTYYPVLPFVGEVAIIGVNTVIAENAGLMDGAAVKPIPSFEEEEFMGWMQALGVTMGLWLRSYSFHAWHPISAAVRSYE